MRVLSGKPVVDALSAGLETQLAAFRQVRGRAPRLDVILVGDDPASHLYVRNKRREADRLGITQNLHLFSADTSASEVRRRVDELNHDDTVDAVLIQRPLPASFNLSEVSSWIDPSKDVDAFNPSLLGRLCLGIPALAPCTPSGILALLSHYGLTVAGKTACVVGRSPIVGKPLAAMLLNADATVIQCHKKTERLADHTSQADLLFVAAGSPRLIGREHVKPGAVVIDVGIHKRADGTWCGDVRAEDLAGHASAISPVPGGVGPLTIFMLMKNVVSAAQARLDTGSNTRIREP